MASIHKRNNKFCVVYYYINSEGIKKQKWETYHTRAEAERRRSEIEYKGRIGEFVVPACTTLKDLLKEYVGLYGRDKWSLSFFEKSNSLIENYIRPVIGSAKLSEINTRYLEMYYQKLLTYPAAVNPSTGKPKTQFVTPSTITSIHKLLRSCFNQAVKWELMEKNPAVNATVPKHKERKREIWDVETLMKALESCEDEKLKLAINLSFTCTLRIGELLGLTWDCVDISEEAVRENRAFLYVNKELQRVDKEALKALSNKDVILMFPELTARNRTVRVLKAPKTESSTRKVFLPKTVARMLSDWREKQQEIKEMLGEEYQDYNLVLTSSFGMPLTAGYIRKAWEKLIEENGLDPVVFHSLRHMSVTYKLKLNGGDIKAVQGDSGHSQVKMVTDVYSHIIDEDRKKNAELFEKAFYENKTADPQFSHGVQAPTVQLPEGVDPELLQKVLSNPEMMALLAGMAKAIENKP